MKSETDLRMSEYGVLVIDETFVAWVPKMSKLGGLPNYSFEPRKPKGLGTMLRDAALAVVGTMMYTDPVMSPSVQDKKMFGDRPSQSPDAIATSTTHAPHTAEVLRQAYYSNLKPGSWIVGDAWFGSVATCLALKKEKVVHVDEEGDLHERTMDVESTFIVKNNTKLFPRRCLLAVLRARYPERMVGHWVVFRATIEDVDIKAVCYAWSNRDTTMLVSTVGNTYPAQDPYVSLCPNFAYDGGETKQHCRPDLANVFMKFLPEIDTLNKLRQDTLQVEEKWPTKNCWKKLFNGYIGMSVCNQKKLLSYYYPQVDGRDMTVRDMAASISSELKTRQRRILPVGLRNEIAGTVSAARLSRIASNTKKAVPPRQQDKRSAGSSKQRTCFICKKYYKQYTYAVGQCQCCGTCLCLEKKFPGRDMTCHQEHLTSSDPRLICNGVKKVVFPPDSRDPGWK